MQSLNTQEHFGIGEDLEFASSWYGKARDTSQMEKKKKTWPHIEKNGLEWAQLGENGFSKGKMGIV